MCDSHHSAQTGSPPFSFSRRQLFRFSAASAAAVAASSTLSSCASSSHSDEDTITIGFLPITCSAPLIAAVSRDIFPRYGLNVKLIKYSGWAEIWTAYAAGQIDISHMLAPMPLAIHHGVANEAIPTRLAMVQNTNGEAITLANKHQGKVHGPEDFKGMTLGIPFDYSMHNFLLRDYLSTGGLDPDQDVAIRVMRPADMVANLATNNIDGYIAPEPFNQRSVAAGYGFLFKLSSALWDGHPCCGVGAREEWIRT